MNLPATRQYFHAATGVGEFSPRDEWIFEPKRDGFRTLDFRDVDEVFIQSRDEKPLKRYCRDSSTL